MYQSSDNVIKLTLTNLINLFKKHEYTHSISGFRIRYDDQNTERKKAECGYTRLG